MRRGPSCGTTQIRVILPGVGLGDTKKCLVLFLIYVTSDAKLLSFLTSNGLYDQSVEILETISKQQETCVSLLWQLGQCTQSLSK